jgi:hypothetical protein
LRRSVAPPRPYRQSIAVFRHTATIDNNGVESLDLQYRRRREPVRRRRVSDALSVGQDAMGAGRTTAELDVVFRTGIGF